MGLKHLRLAQPRFLMVGLLFLVGFSVFTSTATAQTPTDPVAELPDTGMQASTPVAELPETGMQVAAPVDQLPATGNNPGQGADGAWIISIAAVALMLAVAAVIGRQAMTRTRL